MGCPGWCPIDFRVYLQMGTCQPLWATCSSVWPPTQYKKCILLFRWNFMCFNLCPLPLVSDACWQEKCLGHLSSFPPIGYLYALIRFSLSLRVQTVVPGFPLHVKRRKMCPMEHADVKQTSGLIYVYPLVSTLLKHRFCIFAQKVLNLFWGGLHIWRPV